MITKLQVYNTSNNNIRIEWFFGNEKEMENWKKEKKDEENKWNYHTPGAVSLRTYVFQDYTQEDLLSLPLNEFEGMNLGDFLKLMKNIDI